MNSSCSTFLVISGGSACNHICDVFGRNVSFVLGISDNGGSTSELLRVLGGPSIGDLRSRLIRLMDVHHGDAAEHTAIRDLLSYRLPSEGDEYIIKEEWATIVEGHHRLWTPITVEKRETIRGFLTMFDYELLKRANKRFNFRNGSIGNFFLTGARLFFGSLEAAIFLFSAITGIKESMRVIPVINTNQTATISAVLENGDTLQGQCEISHPPSTGCSARKRIGNPIDLFSPEAALFDNPPIEDYYNGNLVFSKQACQQLNSRIRRIYYMNEFGQEIYPIANAKFFDAIKSKSTLVYSIGSLYTSIIPCLILRGVGAAISQSSSLNQKILILNGSNDRETEGYNAIDFIRAITSALNESQLIDARRKFYECLNTERPPSPTSITDSLPVSQEYYPPVSLPNTPPGYPPFPNHLFSASPPSRYMTHLIYLSNSEIHVDVPSIEEMGIQCIMVNGTVLSDGKPAFDSDVLDIAMKEITNTSSC
ncbi:hypothetical protein K450DRAFT_234524 [Umbelopsis ramanniana AG]|uniref:Uncharacterized protein n=1 Tax=Umbelopsis ramanniana AG TaxID=1314678 RepID=A0AAD5EF18_UMBRA|nr:uncharacterized protein K450DRAFT_234524 [Umbelopsis ramanniana AG]KAI8581080.1 hypothetical protein K450DRAFT_234524 [Umbelopsis ramanniana AG]